MSLKSWFTFWNFFSSCFCLTNAFITGIPISISRAFLFMLSIISCVFLNDGITLIIIVARSIATAMNVSIIIQNRSVPSWYALIIPPIPIIGANSSVLNIIPIMLCIWFTSFVVRVISDDLDILFSSWFENFSTFLNIFSLRSFAYEDDTLLEKYATIMMAITDIATISSIMSPVLYIMLKFVFCIPLFTMSAVYVGSVRSQYTSIIRNVMIRSM